MKTLVALSLVICLTAAVYAQAPAPPPPPALTVVAPTIDKGQETTLKDQTDIAVTVYNSNIALVRDTRKLTLKGGPQSLQFSDVAQQIKPETVSLKSVSAPGSLTVIEQNYEYDLMSPSKLMEKYVGKQVRLLNFNKDLQIDTETPAELMSVNEGPIYKVGDKIFLGHPGNVVLPEIPDNLIAKPSLIWLLDSKGGDQTIEATYLTNGIEWRADYVLTLDKAETQANLAGWVTLNNQSGTQYTNAQLKLVAGEVNIAPPPVMAKRMRAMEAMAPAPMMADGGMRQEAFGEYHLYTLPHRTTINQNQSKQVSLLTASAVKVQKVYEYRGEEHFYMQPMPSEPNRKPDHVPVYLKFNNKEDNGLGLPLPGGVMRVYQEDSEKMLQFSGEDRVEHTPKDEEVKIKLGTAFDVVAERKQTDFRQTGPNTNESAFEIKIRNHKTTDVAVDVVEPFHNDWTIIESSQKWQKKEAFSAVFPVSVPKDGETVITYRVRVKYQ